MLSTLNKEDRAKVHRRKHYWARKTEQLEPGQSFTKEGITVSCDPDNQDTSDYYGYMCVDDRGTDLLNIYLEEDLPISDIKALAVYLGVQKAVIKAHLEVMDVLYPDGNGDLYL